jgi:3'(2'), 5'-bisphosphate nucleotidase
MLEQVAAEVRRHISDAASEAVCAWIDRGNADRYEDRFWTLDPIDGTKGFLRGEQYAVALALLVGGRVEVAALACPNLRDETGTGVVFAAHRDEGTFRLPLAGGEGRTPVHVSSVSHPSEARFCESVESAHSSHDEAAAVAEFLGIGKEPLRLDSQAKYGVVARGDAEIYLRLTRHTGYVEKIWDHASGALVIEEAGGRVTDLKGRMLDFSRGIRLEGNAGIVATNGHVHDHVLEALERIPGSS